MRILIFSDLHANWDALSALQAVEPQPDVVCFLGDAVGYGPEPKACVTWLRRHVQYAVRGEHDLAVADQVDDDWPPGEREIALACCDYTRRMLGEGDLAYLRALPEQQVVNLGGARFCLVHKPPDPEVALTLTLSQGEREREARSWEKTHPTLRHHSQGEREREALAVDVILAGHTHVPAIRRVGPAVLVNPGSLGRPCHGSPSATYAVWQDGELAIRHIDYDFRVTQRKLALLPLDPEHVEHLRAILGRGL